MARDVFPTHDGLNWKTLAAIMLTNGSLALLAPRRLAGRPGVPAGVRPATVCALRLFGIRTALVAAAMGELPVRQGLMAAASSRRTARPRSTPLGMRWIEHSGFVTALPRHFPALRPALRGVRNPFAPWDRG